MRDDKIWAIRILVLTLPALGFLVAFSPFPLDIAPLGPLFACIVVVLVWLRDIRKEDRPVEVDTGLKDKLAELTKTVQEQRERIDWHADEIDALEKRIDGLKHPVDTNEQGIKYNTTWNWKPQENRLK